MHCWFKIELCKENYSHAYQEQGAFTERALHHIIQIGLQQVNLNINILLVLIYKLCSFVIYLKKNPSHISK